MTTMDRNHDHERILMDAEGKLARALQRLSALRRAALYGSYDATEFDLAVAKYREAEAEVGQARRDFAAYQEAKAKQHSEPVQPTIVAELDPENTAPPAEATKHHLAAHVLARAATLAPFKPGEAEYARCTATRIAELRNRTYAGGLYNLAGSQFDTPTLYPERTMIREALMLAGHPKVA